LIKIIDNFLDKDSFDAIGETSMMYSKVFWVGRDAPPENPFHDLVQKIFQAEVTWRVRAKAELLEELSVYDELLKASIGLRMQRYMTTEQAQYVAVCHSHHKDVSLNF